MAQARTNPRDILLLETPFVSPTATGADEIMAYVQSKYNLALLALGSYVRAHSDMGVHLINMVKDRISEDGLIERLRLMPPKVVGVPLYSYNLGYSYQIISRIKRDFPSVHICVGGPHVGMFPKETAQLPNVDSMVIGDGEEPFLQICRQVLERGQLDESNLPPGTTTKASLAATGVAKAWSAPDLDALPIPDLSLLGDFKRYRDFLSDRTMAILTTSRGCPYVCHYCTSEFSKYRSFSVDRVVEIMRHYKEHGVEYVEFWDETFNPNKKRLADFADALERADLKLAWGIRGSVVLHVPYETMVRLKKTGLVVMQFGVETSQKRLAKYLNKLVDTEVVAKAFDTCHRAGVRTVANMMINIPGQTKQELAGDLAFLKRIKATYVNANIYNWAPGTTHYADALRSGVLDSDHWRIHAANPVGPEPILHANTEMSIAEVYKIRDRFIWWYYFNPIYIIRYLGMVEACELKRAVSIASLIISGRVKSTWFNLKAMFSKDSRALPRTAGKQSPTPVRRSLSKGMPEVSHIVTLESA